MNRDLQIKQEFFHALTQFVSSLDEHVSRRVSLTPRSSPVELIAIGLTQIEQRTSIFCRTSRAAETAQFLAK